MARVNSSELKQNTKAVLDQAVQKPEDPVVIYNYNEPVAVIVEYKKWLESNSFTPKKTKEPEVKEGTLWDRIAPYIPEKGVKFDSHAFIRELRDED